MLADNRRGRAQALTSLWLATKVGSAHGKAGFPAKIRARLAPFRVVFVTNLDANQRHQRLKHV
jgi:hypothetical protein